MHMLDQAGVYEIHMVFKPDGTKEGDLIVSGVNVGKVTMDVDGTSTYLNIDDETTYPIDE